MKYALHSYLRIAISITTFLCTISLMAQEASVSAHSDPRPSLNFASQTSASRTGSGPEEHTTRQWLESHGIVVIPTYKAELFGTLHGGTSAGTDFLGSADITFSFDLNKLGIGRGDIVVSAQNLHGHGISDRHIGTIQAASNLEEGVFSKLVEAYYSDAYLDHRLVFKVGRQYADADFNVVENAADFLNSSYGLIPTVPMPTYPAPRFGASVWSSPTSWISFGAGVFEGNALDPIAASAKSISTGVFTLAEAKISPYPSDSPRQGTYHFGVWRQARSTYTAEAADQTVANYGLYATADHWFHKPDHVGNNVGPGLFFQLGWAPSDRNAIHRYVGGGIAWPGLIPHRPSDSIGVGIARASLTNLTHAETVTELFYKCKITSKLFVEPDVQYARHPSGTAASALAGGLRIGFEF